MPWWACFDCITLRNADDIYSLDFSHHLLHDVPPDVFQYERTLEELYLNSNRIADLPRQLFYCQELKILNLNDNEISVLPAAISSLTNLQRINLSKNALTSVVDNIKSCKHLVSIDLSLNSLIKLPDAITSLISIQELYLNDVFLEYLPANFGRLVNLRILELRDNNLSTLPKSMARLTNLTRIDIGHNEFTELPEVIGQLSNLTELWVDNNRIRRVSSNVGNLVKLVHFEASNNLLTHLPNEVSNWIKLEELSISVNDFKNLPISIGSMKSLIAIKADENNLQELPDSICQLEHLEELMVSHNDLFRLPPAIGLLRRLRFLTADENLLRHLPNELCSCISLTILSVRGNKLSDIPPDIGHLINLRVINIVNNFITHLPVSVLNLQQLSALWISDNQSQPLMPLQKEYGPEQSVYLTCFMLPQTTTTKINHDKVHSKERDIRHFNSKQLSPFDESSVNETEITSSKRRICFASDPVVSVEQTGRLMRSPTPYPKELRVLAKYARYIQKTGSPDGAHADEIQETKHPQQTAVEIKEARVTNNALMLLNNSSASTSMYVGSNGMEHTQKHYNDENCDQFYVEQEPLLVQPNNSHYNQHMLPVINSDTLDSKTAPSCFYSPVNIINGGNVPIIDFENVSTYSGSTKLHETDSKLNDAIRGKAPSSLSGDFNSIKEPLISGIRMSQASSFGDESLTGAFEEHRLLNNEHPYYHNISSPSVHNQYYPYMDAPTVANNTENNHNPNHYINQQYPESQQHDYEDSYYAQLNVDNVYPSNMPDIWANHASPRPSEIEFSNHDFQTTRQPPPYHIAKAFTKKSKTDLLIYDHYRNLNGTPDNDITNNLHATEMQAQSETSEQCMLSNGALARADTETELLQTQQNGLDELDSNLNSSNGSNNGYSSEKSNESQRLPNLRGKSPWVFGLHKNPKVLQLSVSKNPHVGFKIVEVPKQGIFVSDVSINSSANALLQKMDKILDIDGVDFTRISIKEALTVLSNSGPVINIMISRT